MDHDDTTSSNRRLLLLCFWLPSRKHCRPMAMHSFSHSLSLSAANILFISHHSFISWPSKKPNKKCFFCLRCLFIINRLNAQACTPLLPRPVLRANQSFITSTLSNCIHQLYLTHSLNILCNFFHFCDFRGRNERWKFLLSACVVRC